MPHLEVPDSGFLRDGSLIHFQPGRPGVLLKSHLDLIMLLLAVRRGGPLIFRVLGRFLLFGTLLRDHLPFLQLLHWSLLLQVWIDVQSEVSGGLEGEEGVG